jgi:Xaa-Pro aminopeptidase
LNGSKFVDATEQIDRIKVIKSQEEVELIKQTAQLQDAAMEEVKKSIRPGRRDFEIYAEALHFTALNGSERQLILVSSGPPGTPVPFQPRHFQNRVMKDGDQVSVLIELQLLKPGADPKDLWNANNEFLEKNGYFPERRLYAHGQGYDLVERPLIRYDEPMKIKAGMNLTVHPQA